MGVNPYSELSMIQNSKTQGTKMNRVNMELLIDSISILQNCKNTLLEISETSDTLERSYKIKKAQLSIDEVIAFTNDIISDSDNAHKSIDELSLVGSQISILYKASSEKNPESRYQGVFSDLMFVRANMFNVLDHSYQNNQELEKRYA